MKISLTWLKEYIPIKVSTEKITEKLTMVGGIGGFDAAVFWEKPWLEVSK